MHGGLSPEMEALQQIADLARPCDVPDVGLMCDLLWSDPDGSISVSCVLCVNWSLNPHNIPFFLLPFYEREK